MAAAVTMARMRIKLAHELRDEALRVSKEHEGVLQEFATTAVAARTHVDVDVISSCEQTAADARAYRREAPQKIESR